MKLSDRVLIVGDIHLGVNKNNPIFFETALKYADWIVSVCEKNKIDTIVQLGDIFHNREMIHVPTLNCANDFFEKLHQFDIHIVTGNHDCLYNEISDVNSLKLLQNWPNITVHEKVSSIDGVCFCGWGTKLIDIPDDQRIIFGHFDIKGFEMSAYKISEHGFTASDLMDKCKFLMSGHYHKPQVRFYNKKPLVYAGSTYQLNWGESGEDKFVYILDTTTLEYTPIKNEISPRFQYIRSDKDFDKVANNFVSIELDNHEQFPATIAKLKALNAVDVRTTIRSTKVPLIEDLDAVEEFQIVSVPFVIDECVERLVGVSDADKKLIAEKAKLLYHKCI